MTNGDLNLLKSAHHVVHFGLPLFILFVVDWVAAAE